MGIKSKLHLILAVLLSHPISAHSDCMPNYKIDPGKNETFPSPEAAIKQVQSSMGLIIAKSPFQSKCGGASYDIFDSDGTTLLGQIDVSAKGDNSLGTMLYGVVKDFNKTPKAQHLALIQANKDFYQDRERLEEKFGLTFYQPNALPDSKRFPGSGSEMLYATMEKCFKGGGSSSGEQLGTLNINTTEYIFGRQGYSENTIYQPGDLEKAFKKNRALLKEVVLTSKGNQNHCHSDYSRHDWEKMNENLKKEIGKNRFNRFSKSRGIVDDPKMQSLLKYDFAKKSKYGQTLYCLNLLSLVSECDVKYPKFSCNPLMGVEATEEDREKMKKGPYDIDREERSPKGANPFVLKRPGDRFVYLFTDQGIYKVNLEDQDIFKPGESPKADIHRHNHYLAEINGKTYSITVAKQYYGDPKKSYAYAEENIRLQSDLGSQHIQDRCRENNKEDGAGWKCINTASVALSDQEASKLLQTISKNQIKAAIGPKDGSYVGAYASDCSLWEKIQTECHGSVTDDASKTLIDRNLAFSYDAGVASGENVCKKKKKYSHDSKKGSEQGKDPNSAGVEPK